MTAANVHDSRMLEALLAAVAPVRTGRRGRPRRRPAELHAHKGCDYRRCRRACAARGIKHRIARRGIESKERLGRHRWTVDRDDPQARPEALDPADTAALVPAGTDSRPSTPGPYALTPAEVAAEVGTAEAYREKAYAASTLRAYRGDWRDFVGYCAARGASPLPADPLVVRTYLAVAAERDGRKVATLQRRIAAIAYHHREAGHALDTQDAALRATWRGIRRDVGVAPTRKAPAVTEAVKAMVAGLPDTLVGVRDRALLLLGFAGAFRRSEL